MGHYSSTSVEHKNRTDKQVFLRSASPGWCSSKDRDRDHRDRAYRASGTLTALQVLQVHGPAQEQVRQTDTWQQVQKPATG
jgi:hypothetical protein